MMEPICASWVYLGGRCWEMFFLQFRFIVSEVVLFIFSGESLFYLFNYYYYFLKGYGFGLNWFSRIWHIVGSTWFLWGNGRWLHRVWNVEVISFGVSLFALWAGEIFLVGFCRFIYFFVLKFLLLVSLFIYSFWI